LADSPVFNAIRGRGTKAMKKVEYWRWRYRDPTTDRMCRTRFHMTEQQAAKAYPGAERVDGTMLLLEPDEFVDTTPGVHHPTKPD
jgi:hypothetical protein